ncbi:uncharacterized protein BCR38DRAFT_486326 [Pseudomassariella vexata]|uniref:Alpha-L-rhamnosidase six-hairpin glycosidase domain-containing protein n=1 Tax=Pseudomassariella vexata TaxID=1141098 RepID=A0A1Y2DS01_9PEZI|nr:uncharacterized protein BCR38DRAFT_486326 [Pseudomassariella vexata]ORY62052.1 hypothetical protein BCR38DRAFT_486326 [Pseudomassariella vexata]
MLKRSKTANSARAPLRAAKVTGTIIFSCPPQPLQDWSARNAHTKATNGPFHRSNSRLNQLHKNVLWSTRGNFLSIPADYPQRYHITRIIAQIAGVIGEITTRSGTQLTQRLGKALRVKYITLSGLVVADSQTSLAIAFAFSLHTPEDKAGRDLAGPD